VITLSLKEIKFDEIREKWFSYELSDGTTLKLKPILIKVIDEGEDEQGNPMLCLQATNVVGISSSESINVENFKEPKKDIKITPLNDNWNEYKLKYETRNEMILKLKPVITQIDRTGKLDPKGLPIYAIQSQQLFKLEK